MICTKVVKYVALNLYFVTLGNNLSLPINLFHEDKSAAKVCPIEYDRFYVIAIYRMSRRTRITGNICYRQNSCIQSLLVFWQISLWIRFDNWAIRHRLLADSQMNEFVVNRRRCIDA